MLELRLVSHYIELAFLPVKHFFGSFDHHSAKCYWTPGSRVVGVIEMENHLQGWRVETEGDVGFLCRYSVAEQILLFEL